MIIGAFAVVGAILGGMTAYRRNGNRLDIAQYAAGYAIAFAVLGMILGLVLQNWLV